MTKTVVRVAREFERNSLLEHELRRIEIELGREGGSWLLQEPIPSPVADGAKQALEVARAALAPAHEATAVKWMAEMCRGFPRLPPNDDLNRLFRVFWEDCGDLPASVWSEESARSARRTFEHFPTSAKLYSHLTGYARPAVARVRSLEILLRRPVQNPGPKPTEAEKAHVRKLVVGVTSELAGRSRKVAVPRPPQKRKAAVPIDRTDLRKVYEEIAAKGAPDDAALARAALQAMDHLAPEPSPPEDAEAASPARPTDRATP